MNIKSKKEGNKLIVYLEGRVDSITASTFEEYLQKNILELNELELDFEKLEYISSAGLRVLLFAQKTMSNQGGKMSVSHVNEDIMETFELTCFTDILTII